MQKSYSFDRETIKKTLKGALIAGGGVAVTMILQSVSEVDFGANSVLVGAVCSILINVVNEFVKGE
jgi:hypothetical protein